MLANVAIAAMHAREARGLERLAIVDWDVHLGNGTQDAFFHDPSVLTISIHQDRAFPPDSGLIDEIGAGRGEGYNINIPLPPGSGTCAYETAWERLVVPALRRFGPEMIFVASGFDASAFDPMGWQLLHSDAYRGLTRDLLKVASERPVAGSSRARRAATTLGMCRLRARRARGAERYTHGGDDPFLEVAKVTMGQELEPHEETVIPARLGGLLPIRKLSPHLRQDHPPRA